MTKKAIGAGEVDELVAGIDVGARDPAGWQGRLIIGTAFVWALFQLYIASNLPFTLTEVLGINVTVNTDQARFLHLAFGLVLAAFAYPLFKRSARDRIPGTTGRSPRSAPRRASTCWCSRTTSRCARGSPARATSSRASWA